MWDVVVVGLGGVGSFALRSLSRPGRRRRRDPAPGSAPGGSDRPPPPPSEPPPPPLPLRVLGLERFRVGHAHGSSHGGTRIFRHAYFEHPDYVPLLLRSTEEFRSLQGATGHEGGDGGGAIVERCGCLIVERARPSPGGGGGGAAPLTPLIDRCLEAARRHSVEVELLGSGEELGRRFPQFSFRQDHVGLYEPGGGFVRPERAVQAAIDDALRNGGGGRSDGEAEVTVAVREGVRVTSIEECNEDGSERDHVVLRVVPASSTTDEHDVEEEVILARKVIVAGGPWAGELIPQWSPHLRVTRQIQAWISVPGESGEPPASHHPGRMPTWLRAPEPDDPLPPLYGFPCDPLSDHPDRVKLALHGRDELADPDDMVRRKVVIEADLEELARAAAPFLLAASPSLSSLSSSPSGSAMESLSPRPASTGLHITFADAKSCLYTVSPDGHFLLGQPKGSKRVFAAAGLSGHGFKMVPALGEALAELTLHGQTDLPVGFLSPSRFGV